jgi:hypothetical protein
MCLSCGVSNYSGAVFHITCHGFFKALLFNDDNGVHHNTSFASIDTFTLHFQAKIIELTIVMSVNFNRDTFTLHFQAKIIELTIVMSVNFIRDTFTLHFQAKII